MEHSTLYDEKRTLVEKVVALTEINHKQDQLIMIMLKKVNEHCRYTGSPIDEMLCDEFNDLVLKYDHGKNTGFAKSVATT